jgi:virginiamycin B lyase
VSSIRLLLACAAGVLAVLSFAPVASAIDEFPLLNPCPPAPSGGSCEPGGITAGPDGALWFTEENGNRIGRITTGGAITEFTAGLSSGAKPVEITPGPGGLWFSESGANNVGLITTAGSITEFPVGATTDGIAAGPDGNVWFTEPTQNRVGKITPGGSVSHYNLASCPCEPGDITQGPPGDSRMWFTEGLGNRVRAINPFASNPASSIQTYDLPSGGSDPSGITASAGALWFAEFGGNRIGRLSTTGALTEFPAGSGQPSGITTGSDGALWFTQTSANKIGRMTASGSLTNEFVLPGLNSQPGSITGGPDGALWFTELVGNKIGRIAPAPTSVPLPPPRLPVTPPATTKKKRCKVPKLRRLTVKKARRKLKRAGCKYKIRGKGRFSSSKPKAGRTTSGTVIVRFKARKRTRR